MELTLETSLCFILDKSTITIDGEILTDHIREWDRVCHRMLNEIDKLKEENQKMLDWILEIQQRYTVLYIKE